jgi:Ser/Thr protein kinase RdoA (MazF antagonist)
LPHLPGIAAEEKETGMTKAFTPQDWIRRNGPAVARTVFPDGRFPCDIDVAVVARRAGRMVLRVEADGEAVAVKAFDPADPVARAAFGRERAALRALTGSGLAPAVRAEGRREPFVILDWIEGKPLVRAFDPRDAAARAGALGHWLAACAGRMAPHGRDADLDWQRYLACYPDLKDDSTLAGARGFLEALPIRRLAIAHNDAVPGNFLVHPDGSLTGIDFEAAALKPLGWDVLLAARMLARRFPGAGRRLCDALVDGWGQGTECLPEDAFRRLVQLFAQATAFAPVAPAAGPA